MSGDGPKIVSAYIEIQARKAADFDRDARRMGEEAGKEYQKGFDKEAGKDSPGERAKRAQQGKQIGDQIGVPAGKAAGEKTSKGITESLAKSRVQREKDGEEVGRVLGASAGKRAAGEVIARFRHQRAGFIREGEVAGEAFGGGMTASFQTRLAFGLGTVGSVLRSRLKRDGAAAGTAGGIGAAAAFRAKFVSGLRVTSAKASAILESDLYQGINKGFKRGLLSAAGIGLLASSISGLATVVSGTVGAVVSLSGAVGILPGILVSAGTAAGALKLGLFGVGDAIKNSGDPAAYAKSIEKLSPAARGFTDAIVKLRPQLKSLQQSVQDGLFKGAGEEITALGTRYLPILKRGLTGITEAFGRGRSAVAAYLDTAKTAGVVGGILDDTSLSADSLSRAFRPFVSSLLDIAAVGTTFLPALSSGLADAADRFAAFTTRTKDSGQMRDFFQGGIDAVGDLGAAVGGVARIIGGIFKAGGAANSSPLETFAKLLNDIADTVNKPAFQAGLSHFFDAIATAGAGLGEKMGELGDALVALEPTISRIVAGSGVALPSILSSISSAAISLAPVLNFLGAAFESIAPHAGPLVIALVGIKLALLGLSTASKVVAGLAVIQARILTVGTAAVATRIRLLGLAASLRGVGLAAIAARVELLACTSALKLLGAAAVVVAVAALARKLGEISGQANVASVDIGKLTTSLESLGRGGQLGAAGLELFSTGGLFGLVKNGADDSAEALDRFGTSAFNALDQGWDARLGRWQSFGQAEASFEKQTKQLDSAFSAMAKNGNLETASVAFEKFIKAGVDAGVPVSALQRAFPQFQAAIAASGGSVDTTTGKVKALTMSLSELISKTDEYAGKTLNARESARNYEAALDAAREAVNRNGKSLSITSGKGRENSAALDAIAASGISLAKQMAGDGPDAQAKFRTALLRTRADLVAAAVRFGLSERAARRYADRVLAIPSKASTLFSTPGLTGAAARALQLSQQLKRIPTNKTVTVTTRFYQVGREPGTFGNGLGVNAPKDGGLIDPQRGLRRAAGGLIDPRLGAPRQDNVPLLVSGGEFFVNAYATAAKGVLPLLRYINSANRLPDRFQGFAGGGKVAGRASVGLGDLTASTPARIQRMETAPAPEPAPAGVARLHPDDITAITQGFAAAMRQQRIVLDSGVVAGAVLREGGRSW